MLEMEAVPQSCIPLSPDLFEYCFIYEKFVACREFDFRPSNQFILVRVIPSCFRFAKKKKTWEKNGNEYTRSNRRGVRRFVFYAVRVVSKKVGD
jgi:hypothetical protein